MVDWLVYRECFCICFILLFRFVSYSTAEFSWAMADQQDSWDEVGVQWGGAVTSRIRAKETSGSTDPGPATGEAVMGELETTSVSDRGAVHRDSSLRGAVYGDSSLLTLAAEDPDATLRIRPETYLHFGFPWAGTKDRRCPRSYRHSKVGQLRAGTLHWLRNLGLEMAIALLYSACNASIAVRCKNAGQPRSGHIHAQYKKDKLLYKKCIREQQVAETNILPMTYT